jgi:hypothetical protein
MRMKSALLSDINKITFGKYLLILHAFFLLCYSLLIDFYFKKHLFHGHIFDCSSGSCL